MIEILNTVITFLFVLIVLIMKEAENFINK